MAMPASVKRWTLDEVHRLPDDGNRYEVIHGELFVTPAPSPAHEEILVRLTELLTPYVRANRLGRVYHPRAVIEHRGSEAEPDLMVRSSPPNPGTPWAEHPVPILVVECVSLTTRRRDYGPKRDFYTEAGVDEYWIVDRFDQTIRIVRRESEERIRDVMRWHPAGAGEALTFSLAELFGGVTGDE